MGDMTQELFDELSDEFWRTSGVMTFSQVAIKAFGDQLSWTLSDENPDPVINIGAGDPNDPTVVADASWRKSHLDGAATADGWLQQWLTQAWIALIFARWEDYYRPGFAALHGVETRAITSDVIGDIRHMRNDVIHHGSVATAENTGKCRVLTRFETGEQIIFTPEDVRLMKSALQVTIES